ncbi:hypothetical protein F4801DRAFT_602078 [Xylaria longipes]|nr:hypothetical protein F4801DRAFT_602078 [Xylaria longipes]
MANNYRVLWRAPASILGGLLAGILISVGHHLYYASLEGTSPEGSRIIVGYRFSNQAFTTAVGTAFAFIVRAFLLFAVSGAYVQVFWHSATHARKVNTLEEIDAMLSILSNLFAFRAGSSWWKYPMLLLIALIAWLLPIAFTIPPASISVIVAPVTTSASKRAPNFDFASLRYVASMPMDGAKEVQDPVGVFNTYLYNGPSAEVQKVANAVAYGGTVLPITPPAANSSWQLDFYGPSLICHPMDDNTRLQVESSIAYWLWEQRQFDADGNCDFPKGYLTWSSREGGVPNPFLGSTNEVNDLDPVGSSSFPLGPGNMTFLQCDLHNASYHAAFNYESGRQSIAVQANHKEMVHTAGDVNANISDTVPYIFDEVLVKLIKEKSLSGLLRHLSYTAIADAFYQIIKGSVTTDEVGFPDTKIISTVLIDTPELGFLSSLYGLSPFASTLQEDLWHTNTSKGQSLSSPRHVNRGRSLQNTLEEMFQNITISLMSSELLQPNMTSEYAPPMPNVTTTTYEPLYQYSSRQLWIAYGVAIAASAVASLFGLLVIFFNDASYSSNFSSVYRTACSSRLDATMQAEDMKATDPLPRYLAKAALYITNSNSTAKPGHGNEQRTTLAAITGGSSEVSINRSKGTTEGADNGPRVANHSDAGNVAGYTMPILDIDISKEQKLCDVNLWGPIRTVEAFANLLIASRGRIVKLKHRRRCCQYPVAGLWMSTWSRIWAPSVFFNDAYARYI